MPHEFPPRLNKCAQRSHCSCAGTFLVLGFPFYGTFLGHCSQQKPRMVPCLYIHPGAPCPAFGWCCPRLDNTTACALPPCCPKRPSPKPSPMRTPTLLRMRMIFI